MNPETIPLCSMIRSKIYEYLSKLPIFLTWEHEDREATVSYFEKILFAKSRSSKVNYKNLDTLESRLDDILNDQNNVGSSTDLLHGVSYPSTDSVTCSREVQRNMEPSAPDTSYANISASIGLNDILNGQNNVGSNTDLPYGGSYPSTDSVALSHEVPRNMEPSAPDTSYVNISSSISYSATLPSNATGTSLQAMGLISNSSSGGCLPNSHHDPVTNATIALGGEAMFDPQTILQPGLAGLTYGTGDRSPAVTLPNQYVRSQNSHILGGDMLFMPEGNQYPSVRSVMPAASFDSSGNIHLGSQANLSYTEGFERKNNPAHGSDAAGSRLQMQHRTLLLYHHAMRCSTQKGECESHLCNKMKRLLHHIYHCNGNYCAIRCFRVKILITHYGECSSSTCCICGPVMKTLEKGFRVTSSPVISERMASIPSVLWGQKETAKDQVPGPDQSYAFHEEHGQGSQEFSRATIVSDEAVKHKEPSFSSYLSDKEQLLSKRKKTEHASLSFSTQNEANELSVSAAGHTQLSMDKHSENNQVLGTAVDTTTYSMKLNMGPSSCFPRENSPEHLVVNIEDPVIDVPVKSNVELPATSELAGDMLFMPEGNQYSSVRSVMPAASSDSSGNIHLGSQATENNPAHGNVAAGCSLRRQHRALLLYHHAMRCSTQMGECESQLCIKMQRLLHHISHCNGNYCAIRCFRVKRLITHYGKCSSYTCCICGPVKKTLEKGFRVTSSPVISERMASIPSVNMVTKSPLRGQKETAKDQVPGPDQSYAFHEEHGQGGQEFSIATIDSAEAVKRKEPSFSSYLSDKEQPPSKRKKTEHPSLSFSTQNEAAELSVSAAGHTHLSMDKHSENNQVLGTAVDTATYNMKLDMGPSSCFPRENSPEHLVVNVEDPVMDVPVKFNVELSATSELVVAQPEQENLQIPLEAGQVEIKDICMTTTSSAICAKREKMDQPKKKCISLIHSFTPEKIREHISSLKPLIVPCASKTRSMENAEENKGTGHVMDENTCSLCWMKNLRFQPPAKYCACCSKKINPKGLYYLILSSESGSDGQSLLCAECINTRPKVDGKCIPKENLQRRENYAETEDLYERWVQCGKCDSRQHGICALINFSRNEAQTCYTCPTCFLQERESGEHETLPHSMAFGAEDLPTTMLSDHIEQHLFRRLKEDRQERASSLGKNFYEVPAAEGLVVRVVSSFVKKVEVKQNFRDIFQKEKYPSEFPYKSKAILLFQKIDGADVLLFAMYVQEYGSECAFPNRRQVCISYIDSVRYFKPEIPAASGEALRTFVYHEILIGYLDYSKKRGFNSCYIWVCPPSKGDDYILHCHPNLQKIPKPDKLRGWYQNLLRKAIKEEIVAECTKFYDQFFIQSKECKAKLSAARMPYYDNDYWPGVAEVIISQGKNVATSRSLRAAKRNTRENNEDFKLMLQLEEEIRPVKDNFIMVHLQHACKHCCNHILSGKRWVCSVCENFQLCEECFLLEQNLEEKDRHPFSKSRKHSFHNVEVEEVFPDSDWDETMHSEIFDTRLMFLGHCQKFHYQFDTLRRAKHSTMMILYDLHNTAAPASQ